MKILLACCSGMSTSLVVNKMKDAAKKDGRDDEIWAVGQGQVDAELPKADVLLIGPQMRMMKKTQMKTAVAKWKTWCVRL